MASSRTSVEAVVKPFRGPWEGEDKIVVGIDIGTTQSGVAFSFFQNGESQAIHRVTRWPGQEAQNQQGKIPTVVWYDSNKRAVSFGAEATSHDAEGQAEDNGWILAKHFKLHLHPNDMRARHNLRLDSLPVGVTLQQIYSDFMGYLLKHTQAYFEERIIDGKLIWQRFKPAMEVIIAHPNGWGVREQTFLRDAAVKAGFSTADKAASKIRFVSEAEASVHFCIYHTNLGARLQPGTNFAVCDAGGSTVDTTLYSVASARPLLKLEEQRASACVQAGAIFVDTAIESYLKGSLNRADLGRADVEHYSKAGVKDFEAFAKRSFSDASKDYSITIADTRFTNPAIRTRRGRMTLAGSVIKSCFDTCLQDILSSVDAQVKDARVSHILLVGGFGDSPYLRNEFRKRYGPQGSQVALTNDSSSKAVADGAVIWHSLSSVVARAPRYSFGIAVRLSYSSLLADHRERTRHVLDDGDWVYGSWSPIVTKGIPIDVNAISRRQFWQTYFTSTPNLRNFEISLLSYAGSDQPSWAQDKEGLLASGFQNICRITADLNNLSSALEHRVGPRGKSHWSLVFEVCIRFGGTELEAYVEWKEQGITRTGPISIIPGDPTGN